MGKAKTPIVCTIGAREKAIVEEAKDARHAFANMGPVMMPKPVVKKVRAVGRKSTSEWKQTLALEGQGRAHRNQHLNGNRRWPWKARVVFTQNKHLNGNRRWPWKARVVPTQN